MSIWINPAPTSVHLSTEQKKWLIKASKGFYSSVATASAKVDYKGKKHKVVLIFEPGGICACPMETENGLGLNGNHSGSYEKHMTYAKEEYKCPFTEPLVLAFMGAMLGTMDFAHCFYPSHGICTTCAETSAAGDKATKETLPWVCPHCKEENWYV